MSLSAHGNNTSAPEVTNISRHGIWLLAHDKELFLPYDDFPWFQNQPVSAIFNVEEPAPGHYYWPELDIDLTEEIIQQPQQFPNVAKHPKP